MIKKKKPSSNAPMFLITPSLLNAWGYIWNCVDNVRDAESDTISLEDKKLEAQKNAFESFVTTLERLPTEPNKYMLEGLEFEDACYRGETCISPIIEGGSYQIVGKKECEINGMKFLLYGRLDVLKGGKIYDIKRVWKYAPQKYLKSYQHGFYFELFDKAYEFDYLVFDGNKLHIETYYRDQCVNLYKVIEDFIKWLQKNDLLKIYLEKWKAN